MRKKINSESCILFMIVYLMLFILINEQGNISLLILNSTASLICILCLNTKSKHLKKKVILTYFFCTIINLFYYNDINTCNNVGCDDNQTNAQKEYIIDVVFDYLPEGNNPNKFMFGKIINSVPKNNKLKGKYINARFIYKNINIKALKNYSILAVINENNLDNPVINTKEARVLNQIKTPYQKLSFKLQSNLNSILGTKAGGFGWAMLSGSKEFLESNLLKNSAITGTMHLFAVSGLHIGFFYFLISYCLKLVSRWICLNLLVKLFLCLTYVSFLNFPESGIRALLMISIYELSRVVLGKQKGITIFCISALILLLYHPSVIYSVSCQLSFTVVLFIIFIMRDFPLSNRSENPYLKGFKFYPIISWSAAAGSSLLIFDYFNYFSHLCFFTNLLITPFISLFYTLNLLHFICLLFINYSLFELIHEFIFICISNIISYCSFLSSFLPVKASTPIIINNVWHLVIFIFLLFSFCFKIRWLIRFFIISFYYICFFFIYSFVL